MVGGTVDIFKAPGRRADFVGKWGSPNGYFYREKPVDLGVPKFQTSLINRNATPFLWFNIGSIHFGVRCWGCAVGGI